MFDWLPIRIHLTETLVFPPFAEWEDPETVVLVRFPLYKKALLCLLGGLIIRELRARRWLSAFLLIVIPPLCHVLFLDLRRHGVRL